MSKLSTGTYIKTAINTALTTKYADPEKYHQYVLGRGRGRLAKHVAAIAKQSTKTARPTALDLGAGTGIISLALKEAGFAVTATDANPAMVKALKKLSDITASSLDINKPFNLQDNTFDIVTTVWANRYIKKQHLGAFMGEVYRTLKPGGVFVWPLFLADHVFWRARSAITQPTSAKTLSQQLTSIGFVDIKIDREHKKQNRQTKELPNWIYPIYVIAMKPKP